MNEAALRLKRLQRYVEIDPDNISLLVDLTDAALVVGDVALARGAIQRALDLQPGGGEMLHRLSSVALAEGNYEEAVSLAQRLLAEGNRALGIRYNLALALVWSGRHAEAKMHLQKLMERVVELPMVPPLLIRVHHALGEMKEAIALARSFAERDGGVEVAGMLSLLLIDEGDFVSARKWAENVLAADPKNIDALLAAGSAALSEQDPSAACTFLERAVSVAPGNGRAWVGLGLAALLKRDLGVARNQLVRAVQYMPSHIGTWHALAWVELLQGDLDAAEGHFVHVLEMNRNFAESHGGLAAVAAARGDWPAAEERARIARRLDPNSFATHYVDLLKVKVAGDPERRQAFLAQIAGRQLFPGGPAFSAWLIRAHIGQWD